MFAVLAPDSSVIEDGIRCMKDARKLAKTLSTVGAVQVCRHRRILDGDEYTEMLTVEDRKVTHYKGVPAADYISKSKADREAAKHAAKLAVEQAAKRDQSR